MNGLGVAMTTMVERQTKFMGVIADASAARQTRPPDDDRMDVDEGALADAETLPVPKPGKRVKKLKSVPVRRDPERKALLVR